MKDPKQSPQSFIDDAAGMLGGLAGIVSDMRTQVRDDVRSRMKSFADRSELASLEDIQRLEAKIDDIAARLNKLEASSQKRAPQKPAAKKTSAKKTASKNKKTK